MLSEINLKRKRLKVLPCPTSAGVRGKKGVCGGVELIQNWCLQKVSFVQGVVSLCNTFQRCTP